MSDNSLDPLPYVEMTASDYPQKVAATFNIEPHPEGCILRGPCPRCQAAIAIYLFDNTVRGRPLRSRKNEPPLQAVTSVEPMTCTCEHEHPGRPAGQSGCGAYWNLAITTESNSDATQT